MRHSGIVVRIARWSARHRWVALAGWLAFVAAAIVAGAAMGTKHLAPVDTASGQSHLAEEALVGADFGEPLTELVLISTRDAGNADAAWVAAEIAAVVSELRQEYAGLGGVAAVADPVVSADGGSALVEVSLDTGTLTGEARSDRAAQLIEPILAATDRVGSRHGELVVEQAGDASVTKALNDVVGDDLRRAEMISVPITLIILLIAFGALLAAGVPVLLALTAVGGSLGLAALASHLVPMDNSTSSVVLLIGMAVGVDYSLFYIRRQRQERAAGASTRDSIEIAAATSGRAVVVSGVTVLISMAGLFVAGNPVFASMATGTMLVVAVAMIGSVTVLPALLALFGDRIDRPRIALLRRRGGGGESRMWQATLRIVLAHPVICLGVASAALLALAAPALEMSLKESGADDLPRSIPIMRTYDRLNAAFPAFGDRHVVVVTARDGSALPVEQVRAAAAELTAAAGATGLFAIDPAPQPVFSLDHRVARLELAIPYGVNDPRADQSLALLRQRLLPASFDRLPGLWTGVTGNTAGARDFTDQLRSRLPWVFAFVLGLTFVVLLLTFRSVVVALTSIVLNLLSVASAYGLLVLVFQRHWAEGLLDFRSNGGVVSWMPLFLFVVLFGLSMDYHVFLVSRIWEAVRRGLSTRDAVHEGVLRSASTVTSAAVVMVAVFAIFAVLSLPVFKQLGVGLAAAILIDATLIRVVVLPASMTLLGRANWYLPSWLRWLPRIEGDHQPDAHPDAHPAPRADERGRAVAAMH